MRTRTGDVGLTSRGTPLAQHLDHHRLQVLALARIAHTAARGSSSTPRTASPAEQRRSWRFPPVSGWRSVAVWVLAAQEPSIARAWRARGGDAGSRLRSDAGADR